jgi:UDP-N-acetylmuramate dehydrogenase
MLNNICEVLESVDLTNYNTYKIKTSASFLALPKTKEEVINLLKHLKKNSIKYFLLGNGSNVILPDENFDGVVICFKNFNNYEFIGNEVIADAGAMLPKIANDALNKSLKGLEWACGIPGTIGASVRGNAGAYLHEIMESVVSVDILDNDYNIKTINKENIKYDYRTSSLKDNNNIIISVKLHLEDGDYEESKALIQDRLQRRLASQPLDMPSAGSVFRNPFEGQPSGKIIDEAGLKGKIINGAQISEKHANFIVNIGNATSSDIVELIHLIQKEVKEKYDIDLKCEQEIVKWN